MAKKIVDIKIVQCSVYSPSKMEDQIRQALKDGWELRGDMAMQYELYNQVMVKYGEELKKLVHTKLFALQTLGNDTNRVLNALTEDAEKPESPLLSVRVSYEAPLWKVLELEVDIDRVDEHEFNASSYVDTLLAEGRYYG